MRRSEAIKNKMVSNISDVIVIIDKNGNYTYKSPNITKLFGWQPEELIGKNAFDNVYPDDLELAQRTINSIVSTPDASATVEFRYKCKDENYVWIEISVINLLHDRDINGILGNYHNITERKNAEKELISAKDKAEESEERYSGLLANLETGVVVHAPDTSIKLCNARSTELLGLSIEQMIGREAIDPFWKFIYEDGTIIPYDDYPVMRIINSKSAIKNQILGVCITLNRITWLTINGFPSYNEDGEINEIVISFNDISESKLAEENLRKSEAIKNAMVSNISDVIVIIDQNGINQYKSPNISKLFGWSPEECVGNSIWDLVHPDDLQAAKYFFGTILSEPNSTGTTELLYKHKNGNYVWIEISVINLLHNLDINGILGNYHEITERKKAEIDLIAAKNKAEESDRLKTAFLQNISHEIRTPMNAIMGFSGLMPANFNNKEKLQSFADIINQRCNDLLSIITDILDVSKIESGQSTLKNEDCKINELFAELKLFFSDYQNRTNKKHIVLNFIPLVDDVNIKIDKVKLKQILINLITNAFKFTDEGSIECGCVPINNKLQFYVKDTGIGIPEDKKDFVFERFAQIKNPKILNIGGTGLGLSIVKGLVNLLGGEVWLESECYKGTTFYFTIKFTFSKGTEMLLNNEVNKMNETINNKSILIVEDDEYNAIYLKEILLGYFSNIAIVGLGKDAIKYVENNQVDLILMDVRLPDITGYEASIEVLKLKPDIKIITQTAYAAQDEKQKAFDSGCVDYISKPTKQELLLKMINKHLK